jgi:hypothetical protein
MAHCARNCAMVGYVKPTRPTAVGYVFQPNLCCEPKESPVGPATCAHVCQQSLVVACVAKGRAYNGDKGCFSLVCKYAVYGLSGGFGSSKLCCTTVSRASLATAQNWKCEMSICSGL